MSDQSQGPGWWQASDLKWYPPQQATPPPPGAVGQAGGPGAGPAGGPVGGPPPGTYTTPGGYGPPPGPSPFAQPPKKSKAPWIIGILVVLVLLAGGCVAALVAAGRSVSEEIDKNNATVVSPTVPGDSDGGSDEGGSEGGSDEGGSEGAAGTREAPLPQGTDVDLGNGWTVRVDSADLSENAATAVAGANQFNSPAPEGFRYIVVTMTASYQGRQDAPTESPALGFSSSVFGSANVERNSFDSSAVPPEPAFDGFSELAAGGSATGTQVFQIGADETDLVLRFEPVLTFDSTEAWVGLG